MDAKTCTDCGLVKTLLEFYKRSDRVEGYSSACKQCKKDKHTEKYKDSAFRQKQLDNSRKWQNENPLRARYLIAKSLALNPKRRQSREFVLSFEECIELWAKGCHYCHKSISDGKGMGLDRKNNDLGYTITNILPCCGDCNKVRNTVLTVEEMEIAMNAVLAYRNTQKEV